MIMAPFTWIALAALIYVSTKTYSEQLIDRHRQDLFKLRDELFDYANSGKIGFDHQAYRIMRTMINGGIRFGDRTSLFYFLLVAINHIQHQEDDLLVSDFQSLWDSSLASLPLETSKHLKQIHQEYHLIVAAQAIKRSPILALLCIPIFTLLIAASLVPRIQKQALSFAYRVWPNFDWISWSEAGSVA
jgi:hypothetical protein